MVLVQELRAGLFNQEEWNSRIVSLTCTQALFRIFADPRGYGEVRLRVVPHFSTGIVERAKRERAWKSPHPRKGDTRRGERKMRDYRQSPSFWPFTADWFCSVSLRKNVGLLVASFFSLSAACRLFSRGVIFTPARVSLALLSLRNNALPIGRNAYCFRVIFSLRSRRLEAVGERENGRARGRHVCLLARLFFLVPTTSKRLLRRLGHFTYIWLREYRSVILQEN